MTAQWEGEGVVLGYAHSWDSLVVGQLNTSLEVTLGDEPVSRPTDAFDALLNDAITMLAEHGFATTRTKRPAVLQVTPPGSNTTTFDRGYSHPIGLHFDNIDNMGLDKKHEAPLRLSINLSRESRRFCVSPISFYEAASIVASAGSLRPSELAAAALHRRPETPVYSLTVPPRGFYVAPTQNIIHDGTTTGRQFIDYAVTAWINVASGRCLLR